MKIPSIPGLFVLLALAVYVLIPAASPYRIPEDGDDLEDGDDRLAKRSIPEDGDDRVAKYFDSKARAERSSSYAFEYKVRLDTDKNLDAFIRRQFNSIALGGKTFGQLNPGAFALNSTRMQNLAKAFRPAICRTGGTTTQFITFKEGQNVELSKDSILAWKNRFNATAFWGTKVGKNKWENFNVTGWQIKELYKFMKKVGWHFMFDFNGNMWDEHGNWDPTNAMSLIQYCDDNDIYIEYIELFNEPNSAEHKFDFKLSAEAVAHAFLTFKKTVEEAVDAGHLDERWRGVFYLGPETTSLQRAKDAKYYMAKFFNQTGIKENIRGMSSHHYCFDGKLATLDDYLSVEYMDSMVTVMDTINEIRRAPYGPRRNLPILSETADGYRGGSPTYGWAYAAIFLYIDAMANVGCRGGWLYDKQNWRSAKYSVLDDKNNPTPMYFASLAWKRLIYGKAFNHTVLSNNKVKEIRMYTMCAYEHAKFNGIRRYVKGDLVLLVVSVYHEAFKLDLEVYRSNEKDLFIFTGNTALGFPQYMEDRTIFLNGDPVIMDEKSDVVPEYTPQELAGDADLVIPAYSVSYIVIKNANAQKC